jgi:hypothetical protein
MAHKLTTVVRQDDRELLAFVEKDKRRAMRRHKRAYHRARKALLQSK